MMNEALKQSFAWCQQFATDAKSNFVRTFALLRPERARAMYAVYAFARIVDDLGDQSPTPLTAEELQQWRAWLRGLGRSRMATESPIQQRLRPALEYTIDRFEISPLWLEELLDGIESDQVPQRFMASWDELEAYCHQVAGTVGLACIKIWGGDVQRLAKSAKQCSMAFQLTNILRDLREDALRRRIYIPQSDLERFGIEPASWLDLRPTGDWRSLLNEIARTTIDAFSHCRSLGLDLELDGQRMFSLMWNSYFNLLEAVIRAFEVTFEQHAVPRVRFLQKFSCGFIHVLSPLYLWRRPLERFIDYQARFPELYRAYDSRHLADSQWLRHDSEASR